MRKLRLAVLIPATASTMLAGIVPAVADQGGQQGVGARPAHSSAAADIPARYANQVLDWHPCTADELPGTPPPGAEDIECATYTAPRNWKRPDDKIDVSIAVSRLKATGGPATASVLVNRWAWRTGQDVPRTAA